MVDISVVVPARNEEENLPELVPRLVETASSIGDAEIILVNDHSTDKTPDLMEQYASKWPMVRAIHRRDGRRGMGNTLIDGTNASRGKFVVWTMADMADDLRSVSHIVRELRNGADMVFASRYMADGSAGDLEGFKRFMSWGFSFASRLMLGVRVHDMSNAFRGFRREVFDAIKPKSGDFTISPEFSLKTHIAGFRLSEVPTNYVRRKRGVANFKMVKMAKAYLSVFLKANTVWRWKFRGAKKRAS